MIVYRFKRLFNTEPAFFRLLGSNCEIVGELVGGTEGKGEEREYLIHHKPQEKSNRGFIAHTILSREAVLSKIAVVRVCLVAMGGQ